MILLKDLFLDESPIGLCEKMENITGKVFIEIESEDEYRQNVEYYFGMELGIGEICETMGEIIETKASEKKKIYKMSIKACDEKYKKILLSDISKTSGEKSGPEKDQPLWAYGLKQVNSSYAIIVNSPAGIFTPEQLEAVASISREGYAVTKLTHAQRIIILVKPEQLENSEEILKKAGLRKGVLHHGVRNIRACSGALCRWSKNNDAIALSAKIDEALYGFSTKFDVKIAVSDCVRNCSESYCADIGFIGLDGAYKVLVGGRGSSVPFRAFELFPKISREKVAPFIEKFLDWYKSNAVERERLCKTLQRIGTEIFYKKNEIEKNDIKNFYEKLDSPEFKSGDGVSEGSRMFEQYLRGLGVDSIRNLFTEVI